MTEVNVAELRRALEAPVPPGVMPKVIVQPSTLAALLDAYERPLPAAYLRIIESVLARVLAGEPAAQVVADYADEHGGTIQGLEWVEKLVKAADIRRAHTEGVMRLKEAADKRAGALEHALQELLIGVELTAWRHGPQRLRQAYSDARALLEAPTDG